MSILAYLSPAKSLRFGPPLGLECAFPATEPRLLDRSAKLAKALCRYDAAGLAKLMDLSEKLAELNVERFKQVDRPLNESDPACRRCVFLFDGDAYEGLRPETLSADALGRLGSNLRILSGYYGLLRPFDLARAYRLEMGRRPAGIGAKSLYEFWGSRLGDLLALDASEGGHSEALSLASEEYDKAARQAWSAPIPLHRARFETAGPKGRKVVSFDAKRARGLFARHLALGGAPSMERAAESFSMEGWCLDAVGSQGLSGTREWVFVKT